MSGICNTFGLLRVPASMLYIFICCWYQTNKSYLIKFCMKNYDFFHTVMEHIGSHGIMSEKLDKFTPAKFSKDRFSLILCQAHDDNQLKMAAKQLSVDVDKRKKVCMLKMPLQGMAPTPHQNVCLHLTPFKLNWPFQTYCTPHQFLDQSKSCF